MIGQNALSLEDMILKWVLAIGLYGSLLTAFGNNDSLLGVWNARSEHDTIRLVALEKLVESLKKKDVHLILQYSDSIERVAEKVGSKYHKAFALRSRGRAFYMLQEHDRALSAYNTSLILYQEMNDSVALNKLYDRLGGIYHNKGNFIKATEMHQRSLAIADALKDPELIGKTLIHIANMQFHSGQFEEALATHERCLAFYTAQKDQRRVASQHMGMAQVLYHQTRYDPALEHYMKAIEIFKEFNVPRGMAYALSGIGEIKRAQGDLASALDLYMNELSIVEASGLDNRRPAVLGSIGEIYEDLGDHRRAIENYELARDHFGKIEDMSALAGVNGRLGRVHDRMGEHEIAMQHFELSLSGYEEGGDRRSLPLPLIRIGDLYRRLGNTEAALEHLNRALALAEELGEQEHIASALISLAWIQMEKGAHARARSMGERAYKYATEVGTAIQIRDASALLYDVYKMLGKNDLALRMHEQHVLMRDSLLSMDTRNDLIRLHLQNEFEKENMADSLAFATAQELKEMEIAEHQASIRTQRIGLLGISGGLLLIILLAFVIHRSKQRSDGLLLNILPYETAQELKKKGHSDARLIDEVTVMFTDFKGFTEMAGRLTPQELVAEINTCFSAFDRIMERHGVEKIKTIGDAYMAAGGMPTPKPTHAVDTVKAALEIQRYMMEQRAIREAVGLPYFEVRIGVHTGPVVAGIVGIKKFQYDIWGDTVNVASRMESGGEVGRVNVSESTYQLINQNYSCYYRGEIEAKGKGMVRMYFVEGPPIQAHGTLELLAEA